MSIPEAQKSALRNARAKEKEEISQAFKNGYNDAQQKKPKHGYPDKDMNAAYQAGYSKGSLGFLVKL